MKTLLFLIAITCSLAVSGQNLIWKSNFTGTGNNIAAKSTIDLQNNIYVLGYFNNLCSSPTPSLSTQGGDDIFIAKYDPNGNLVWARSLGSASADLGTGIAVSPDGEYIYITGIFMGTCYADNNLQITNTGSSDAFLAKYNKNGDIIWLKNIGNASVATAQRPNEIKIDKNNHLVIGGLFFQEIKLGTSTKDTTLYTTQTIGMFIAKLDTTGAVIKAYKFESSNINSRLYTFDSDASGYYFTGHFNGDLITDLGTYTSNNASLDMFVYKLDLNLESKWIMKAAGTANDQLYSCSVDNKGYFYVGGHFASNILVVDSLPNGTLSKKTGVNKTTNGKNDVFFAKYKHDGTLQWFNTAGSTENDYLYRANFQNGYFIAAGQYGGTLTFRNKTITPFNTADAFAIIHTSSNNLVGLISVGGTGNDTGETSVIDKNNDAIVIGDYASSKIFFTPTDSLVNSNSGTRDIFIAKYHLNLLNIPQTVVVENPYRFKSTVQVDSLLTADSIATQIARVDTLKFNDGTSMSTASTGSTITASDGVYMDGDTVKWKKIQIATGDSVILLAHINNDSASYAGIEKDGVTLVSVSNTSSANVLIRNSYIGIINNSEGENSTNLQIDLTGVHYLEPPDTTLTTPTHLMTEAQVKREIAAAREWISNGEAINYIAGGKTVVNIGNEGSIHVYDAITNYESILTGYEVIVGDAFLYRDGSMRLKVINCSLTDGSPTQGELSSCAGSASLAGQIKLIKDNTTSEMYQIIATGTSWTYIKYTTP